MTATGVVIKQLDHVIVRVEDAARVHRFFSETLQLPVSWPVSSHTAFTSGGIALGNTSLEILTVGQKSSTAETSLARFCAFAFECDSLQRSVKELQRRGLRCSAVVPYIESPSEGEPRALLWSNAFLDGLIGSDLWTRYIIFSTKVPGYGFLAGLLHGSRIEESGISRLFDGALVFLVEYEYQNFRDMPQWSDFKSHDEKRAADRERLILSGGGPLGLESLKEIVVTVKDYETASANWKRLFEPLQAVAEGVWEVADGPAVRLVQHDEDAIQGLVLKVSDLEKAKTFLRDKGMLDSTTSDPVRIDPSKLYGLNIRLI